MYLILQIIKTVLFEKLCNIHFFKHINKRFIKCIICGKSVSENILKLFTQYFANTFFFRLLNSVKKVFRNIIYFFTFSNLV